MPGFQPATLAYSALNGNSVAVLIGTTAIAFAQSVTHGSPFGTEGIYGIGSAKPQEIQQLKVSPHIQLEAFTLTPSGVDLLTGGTNIIYNLANTAFDLHVFNSLNNATMYTYVAAVAQDYGQNIPANQLMRDPISFLAMDVLNNLGQSMLNIPGAYNNPTTAAVLAAASANASSLGLPPNVT